MYLTENPYMSVRSCSSLRFFAVFIVVVYHKCASTYYNTKNQVLKKEKHIKALFGQGLVLVGLILSGYFQFDCRKETI
jgi:peptidoglycan/LPS O-acetylase OafA/YrhL